MSQKDMRVSGTLGLALVTARGFTNALASLVNAKLDRTPVLYLTSVAPRMSEEYPMLK